MALTALIAAAVAVLLLTASSASSAAFSESGASKTAGFETRMLLMSNVAMPDRSHALLAYLTSSSLGVIQFTRGGGTQVLAERAIPALPSYDFGETTYGNDGGCEAVKVAPNGAAVAVWSVSKGGCAGQVFVSYRSVGGSWSAPQAVGPKAAHDHCIRAAIAPSGAAAVIWSDGGDKLPATITAATTTNGSSWKVSSPVSTPEWVTDPALVFDASGTHVFFGGSTRTNHVVLAAAALDGSATGAHELDSQASSQGEANQIGLAAEPDGKLLVSWYRAVGGPIAMMVSDASLTGGAISTTSPVRIGTASDLTQRASSLSLQSYAKFDPAGDAYVVWHSLGSRKITVATRTNGSWTRRGTTLPKGPLLAVNGVATGNGAYGAFSDAFGWFGVLPPKNRFTYTYRTGFISATESGALSVHTFSKFVIHQRKSQVGRVAYPYERAVGVAAAGSTFVEVTERTLFNTVTSHLTRRKRVMRLLTPHFIGP